MRRKWISLVLIAFFFSVASFFLFLSTLLKLISKPGKTGNVGIVEVLGEISDPKPIVEELRDLKKDKDVKAIVLRVDSPGGSVGASQEIYESVKEFRTVKPVVVSMGTTAASGGYYISIPANKIVANAGTITGSIGVRMELVNFEDLIQWAKLKPVTLKSGVLKDAGSPTRSLTPEEKDYFDKLLKSLHTQFKEAVAKGRGLTQAEVDEVSDGRVFTGEEALRKKLVDELGSLNRAGQIAGELAGIKGEPDLFYPPVEKESVLERLVEGVSEKLVSKISQFFLGLGDRKVRFRY